MQTFDQSIFSLFTNDLISYDEALRWASNVDEFKLKVQGISTTADASRDQMANTIFSKPPAAKAGTAKAAPPPKTPEITRFGG
jgi:twitching motility protein PilT